ncbi:vesicle-trafficking protein SEC22c [Oncorhynchus tshawytscha]|uniref:Longin domain-containing protein n=1 Tax=Oncorhynchus tshawytscha TaxID=74940 RepID=A0AAZ3RGT1_ONCTS|nr:vesicle-trafficking protein SEC22c [Oncorhynchus tshawytscha]
MSLILFALVVRVRDGLPLSASTDFQHNPELQERKQQLRTISKALSLFPDRGVVKGHDLNIYFLSSEGVSYMSVCNARLPAAMAFCFLEDLRWEFTAHMDSAKVALAARPYPFLEFDNSIAWLQQQYNQRGGPALEVTLTEVQEDLKNRPLQILTLEEVEFTNGSANGHAEQFSESGQNQRLEPVTAPGILSLVLNIMCSSLNLIRGVHLIEYTFQDDYEGIWNVVAFLLAFLCCVGQCHLYLFHSSLKRVKSLTLLSVVVVCNYFLFGLRNVWQLLFHLAVAVLVTLLTLNRKLHDRTNDCGV